MATRSKSNGTDVTLSMTMILMTPNRVCSAAASRKHSRREIMASAVSCLIETIQVGLTMRTCRFACRTLKISSTGYEITPFGGKRAAFIETADEVLMLEGPEEFCYNVYVADVDVDFYASETPPVVADDTVSPVLSERSASSIKSSGSDVRRKKSKRASKRGSTLSQSANPPVDELEISPSLAAKEAISRDISAEHAKLIQLYANPLEDIPASVAAG